MMGMKERAFTPIERLTLEELVPRDHFYRQLERVLDLGFVRESVARIMPLGGDRAPTRWSSSSLNPCSSSRVSGASGSSCAWRPTG